MACPAVTLKLKRLRCQVRLGCEAWERETPQWVSFDLEFRFPDLPSACRSDEISETVCYSQVSSLLAGVCERDEYKLIERLGLEAFNEVKRMLPGGVRLALEITKERPPVSNLEGGASFRLSEEMDEREGRA